MNESILNLLMANMGHQTQNQAYLLLILEDLAEIKASTKGTDIKDELESINNRFKTKEAECTLAMAKSMAKYIPGLAENSELKQFVNQNFTEEE